jgi:hypothetical protein
VAAAAEIVVTEAIVEIAGTVAIEVAVAADTAATNPK